MGVHATVDLYEGDRFAALQLRGIPVGGSLSGVAWFDKTGNEVEVDQELRRALDRRMVRIVDARRELDNTLCVGVVLPVFGTRTISLKRCT